MEVSGLHVMLVLLRRAVTLAPGPGGGVAVPKSTGRWGLGRGFVLPLRGASSGTQPPVITVPIQQTVLIRALLTLRLGVQFLEYRIILVGFTGSTAFIYLGMCNSYL